MAPEYQTLYQIKTTIRAALSQPLPGSDAHLVLAPRPRRGWHPGHVPSSARRAAALVLLYPHADEPHLLLTVRAGQLAQHAGQVSLPGGGIEPSETLRDAALRETFEEVGVDPQRVQVLGMLSTLYIPASDFALHPVIGIADDRPTLNVASDEVGRVLETSVSELLTTAGPRRGYRWYADQQYQVPYYEVSGERVWGATAMVLAELIAMIGGSLNDPWDQAHGPESPVTRHPSDGDRKAALL